MHQLDLSKLPARTVTAPGRRGPPAGLGGAVVLGVHPPAFFLGLDPFLGPFPRPSSGVLPGWRAGGNLDG